MRSSFPHVKAGYGEASIWFDGASLYVVDEDESYAPPRNVRQPASDHESPQYPSVPYTNVLFKGLGPRISDERVR